MNFKKIFLSLMTMCLALPASLMSQSILEVTQTRKKNDLFGMHGRLLVAPTSGIKSLDGIEQIPGIDHAWSLALSGNDVEVVKANTFNHPQFKNLHALDLSNNKISSVEPGALNGLESLNFLWLSGNQLSSLPDGALSSLNKNKNLFVFVGNNPGGKELFKQVKKQLPKANVYSTSMKQEVLKVAALGAGILAAIVGVVLAGRYVYEQKKIGDRYEAEIYAQQPPLHQAAWIGDVAKIRALIKKGDYVDSHNNMGKTPLHVAARKNNPKAVQALLDAGANVNARDWSQVTPLHEAEHKNLKLVQALLDAGADVDARDSRNNFTPLHEAAVGGNAAVIRALLDAGADVNAVADVGFTALMRAAQGNNQEAIEALLDARAQINAVSGEGKTPFDYASQESIKKLLKSRRALTGNEVRALNY